MDLKILIYKIEPAKYGTNISFIILQSAPLKTVWYFQNDSNTKYR